MTSRDLLDDDVVADVEKRVKKALRMRKAPDHSKHLAELRVEVDNLVGAIATGGLQSSPAGWPLPTPSWKKPQQVAPLAVVRPVPDLRARYREMVERLENVLNGDVKRAQAAVRALIGHSIEVSPESSGEFLVAEFGIEPAVALRAAGMSDSLVAGAGFRR